MPFLGLVDIFLGPSGLKESSQEGHAHVLLFDFVEMIFDFFHDFWLVAVNELIDP